MHRRAWQQCEIPLEVSEAEVDFRGYDLVLELNGIIRHIQMKSATLGSSVKAQKVHTALMEKPSGCVVLLLVNNETLAIGGWRYFGDVAGKPLPDITGLPLAKHTRGNAAGEKKERPAQRKVRGGLFEKVEGWESLFTKLFSSD
jgi:hypothetical protein